MPLREFATRLRDGSLPKDAYSLCDVGGTSLEGAAPFVAELFERLATHALPPKLREEAATEPRAAGAGCGWRLEARRA